MASPSLTAAGSCERNRKKWNTRASKTWYGKAYFFSRLEACGQYLLRGHFVGGGLQSSDEEVGGTSGLSALT